MFWMALQVTAVLASLYYFGILRTCLWLIPCLFQPLLLLLSSGAILSFIAIMSFFGRHSPASGGIDFRMLTKEKYVLAFFANGLLTWALFFPCDAWVLGFGALFPWVFVQVSKVFRLEIPQFFFARRNLRLIPAALWIGYFIGKHFNEI